MQSINYLFKQNTKKKYLTEEDFIGIEDFDWVEVALL